MRTDEHNLPIIRSCIILRKRNQDRACKDCHMRFIISILRVYHKHKSPRVTHITRGDVAFCKVSTSSKATKQYRCDVIQYACSFQISQLRQGRTEVGRLSHIYDIEFTNSLTTEPAGSTKQIPNLTTEDDSGPDSSISQHHNLPQ